MNDGMTTLAPESRTVGQRREDPRISSGYLASLDGWRAIAMVNLTHANAASVSLICTVHDPNTLLARALEWAPVRWLGRISYSLYLWQEPFLIRLGGPYARWLTELQSPPYSFECTFLLAVASCFLVEAPLRKWGDSGFGGRSQQRGTGVRGRAT